MHFKLFLCLFVCLVLVMIAYSKDLGAAVASETVVHFKCE